MNLLDMKTVIISYIISNAMCAIVMAVLWFQNRRRFSGLGFWLADFISQFVALLLNILRGILPDIVSMTISNALVIGGTILLLIGLEQFIGKRGRQLHNIILLLVFIFVHAWFTIVQPSLDARNIILSLGLLVICFQCAWLLLRRTDADMRIVTHSIGIIFSVFCLVSIARIFVDLVVPVGEDFFHSNVFDTSVVMIYQMLFVILTFSLVLMVNRWLVADLERDILERKQAEDALRLGEEKFYKAFHASPDAIIITRASDGRLVEVNEGFSQLTGYSPQEALVSSSIDLEFWLNPQDREACIAALQEQHSLRNYEYDFRTRSGKIMNCLYSGELIQLGGETHILSVVRDITGRKQMEESLRHRNDILAALHQVALDLIDRHEMNDILQALLRRIGNLLEASDISFDLVENDDTLVTYAVTADQPLEKGDTMRRGEGGWLSWQAIETGQPAVLEDYATWPQRRPIFEGYPIHAIMVIPIHHRERVIGAINISRSEINKPFIDVDVDTAQQLAQITALVLDNAEVYTQLKLELSERIQDEQVLHEVQLQVIEQQRALAVFDERQRLARDLHDSVNQSIHSLVLFAETLKSILEKNNMQRARQIADRLQESARQALKETRLLLYEIQLSVPERDVNLVQDLETRLSTVERRAGVKAQIILEGSLENCPREWHKNLFWITIEALNNALKHAQARNMKIVFRCSPQRIELEIMDDGIGFEPGKPRAGGLGLGNMRERARLLGGELTIDSTPETGSRVRFSAEIKE